MHIHHKLTSSNLCVVLGFQVIMYLGERQPVDLVESVLRNTSSYPTLDIPSLVPHTNVNKISEKKSRGFFDGRFIIKRGLFSVAASMIRLTEPELLLPARCILSQVKTPDVWLYVAPSGRG